MSYINPVAGLPTFAMISAISIVDPLLSYPHRLVLSILALHAKPTGATMPTQEHIASLAGWFTKDKDGNRTPNKSYVSSLINNENHAKPSDRCGPGLVQLGYVKVGHKQKGFNQPNTYHLTTPRFVSGYIHRPDGNKTEARFAAPAQREDSSAYKSRKAVEQSAHEENSLPTRRKFTAVDQLPLDLSDTFPLMGDEYTKNDCERDLLSWQDGLARDIPDVVYHHFNVEIPASRDSGF